MSLRTRPRSFSRSFRWAAALAAVALIPLAGLAAAPPAAAESAPLTPTDLHIGYKACGADPIPVSSDFRLIATVTDPDVNPDPSIAAPFVHAAYDVVDVATGQVVFSAESSPLPSPVTAMVYLDQSTLEQAKTYELRVRGVDAGGATSDVATCLFTTDFEPPAAVDIVPVLGAGPVYVDGYSRGGIGEEGLFWIKAPEGSDIATINYGFSGYATASVPYQPYLTIPFTPTGSGLYDLYVEAVDAAGNISPSSELTIVVGRASIPSPDPVTVSAPASVATTSAVPVTITLSDDATTPYGTVRVTEGATTLGSATFDARSEKVTIPAGKLSVGANTLTFTYEAFPGAPTWATTYTVNVTLPSVAGSTPKITGTARAGATLTAQPGTWTSGTTLTYQWNAGGKAVSGATGKTFVPRAAQTGKRVTVTVKGTKPGYTTTSRTSAATAVVASPNGQLGYQGHVQNIGWQPWVTGGQVAGTTGRSLRVEALRFRLNSPAYSGGLTASAHVQNIGWMAPVATGGVVGTQGRSLRVEAFTMTLTGEMAKHYDVYYRTHAQNFGWLGWAKNGAKSGTAGYSLRLEAVDVRLVAKGDPAPTGSGLKAFYQR